MRAVFVDANDTLSAVIEKLRRAGDPPLAIHRDPNVKPDELPVVLGDAEIAIIDHTSMPTPLAVQCRGLKHVVFLGTGARSYMSPEQLAERGIAVHIIKGYGDTAVAAVRHRADVGFGQSASREWIAWMRAGQWLGIEGVQLHRQNAGARRFRRDRP